MSPTAPSTARRALEGLDVLGHDTADTIRLLVTELVTNSVRHAELSAREEIQVSVATRRERLRIEVSDRGPGFDPADRRTDPTPKDASGWGLFLVDQLALDWGVTHAPGKTCVWFELERDRAGIGRSAVGGRAWKRLDERVRLDDPVDPAQRHSVDNGTVRFRPRARAPRRPFATRAAHRRAGWTLPRT